MMGVNEDAPEETREIDRPDGGDFFTIVVTKDLALGQHSASIEIGDSQQPIDADVKAADIFLVLPQHKVTGDGSSMEAFCWQHTWVADRISGSYRAAR